MSVEHVVKPTLRGSPPFKRTGEKWPRLNDGQGVSPYWSCFTDLAFLSINFEEQKVYT